MQIRLSLVFKCNPYTKFGFWMFDNLEKLEVASFKVEDTKLDFWQKIDDDFGPTSNCDVLYNKKNCILNFVSNGCKPECGSSLQDLLSVPEPEHSLPLPAGAGLVQDLYSK